MTDKVQGHFAQIIADPDCCDASKAIARAGLVHATRRDEWRSERRNLVSHATGGRHTGEDMSLNDVCVAITAVRNKIYASGKVAGALSAEASFKAREDALVSALTVVLQEVWDDWHSHMDRSQFEQHFATEFAILAASARAHTAAEEERPDA